MKLYNKINKYKLGIIAFSILLSGCSTTDYFKFKAECAKLPDNYLNESLTSEYEKEKTFYAIENKPDACGYSQRCTILEYNIRWDYVEMYLVHKEGMFPNQDGFYKMYRDYSLNNCISNYRGNYGNEYTNKKGKFCIAARKIEKPQSKIIFKYKSTDSTESSNITKIKTEVIYNNNKYLDIEQLLFSTPSTSTKCVDKDKAYSILLNQFS